MLRVAAPQNTRRFEIEDALNMLTKFSLWGYLRLLIKNDDTVQACVECAFQLARESSCRAECVDLRVIIGAAADARQELLQCLYWAFPYSCRALDLVRASPAAAADVAAVVAVAAVVEAET